MKDQLQNEVRLGNWINFDEDGVIVPTQVDSIEEDNINGIIYTHYAPIELTEEWLEWFGFKHDSFLDLIEKDGFGFKKEELTSVGVCYGSFWVDIKHVHELQNLFRCLTGSELKLKE